MDTYYARERIHKVNDTNQMLNKKTRKQSIIDDLQERFATLTREELEAWIIELVLKIDAIDLEDH